MGIKLSATPRAAQANAQYQELKTRLAEIHDLNKVAGMLGWDQQVIMPARGAAVRAEQMATVGRLAHEKFTSKDIGRLLDDLRPYEESLPLESDEASLIRVARHDYIKASHVPSELRGEMLRTAGLAHHAWAEARRASDFAAFLPHLQKTVDLKLKYVECFDEADELYDILLDDYERGMKTAEVRQVFADVKQQIVPLLAAIAARGDAVSDACLHGSFPLEQQRDFCLAIVRRFGFSDDAWRLDPTVHPFATSSCTSDIRITTRYDEQTISVALFGTMHECGHGLYENGVSPSLERTLLCRGASLGMHESQSRMWENLVGRSLACWSYFYPQLQAAFPDALRGVELTAFYRAINKVQPSLIRVEADELTYTLHIILRFELEQEMMEGRLALRDLPEAWNARMKAYLGVDVPNDAEGVLQDVHWSSGYIGYFPTYALGSIAACQIWDKIKHDIPDLEEQFALGEFMALREWLREHLHRFGRKFTPTETLAKATGSAQLDIRPYVAYLSRKHGGIYGVS